MHNFYDVTIKNLQIFLAVLESGNFSEVARKENVNPSSISRIITQLEAQLNVQLLFRNTRAITPTEDGLLLETYARSVLDQFDEMIQILHQNETHPRGTLKINAPVFFGESFIAPYLQELLTRYPELRVELGQTDRYVDPLHEGAELLFRISSLQDSSMHVKVFSKEQHYLVASPSYINKYGAPESPQSLKDHNCILSQTENGLIRWYFRKRTQAFSQYDVKGSFICNHAQSIVRTLVDGLGIGICPTWFIQNELKKGHLVQIMTDYEASISAKEHYICAMYPKTRKPSSKVRAVIDFFTEKYSHPSFWNVS